MSKQEFLAQYGTAEHAEKASNSNDDDLKYAACSNHLLPERQMKNLVNDSNAWSAHLGLVRNSSTPREVIDKLTDHSDGEVERSAHLHHNVSPHIVDKAIMGRDKWTGTVEALVKSSPHVTKEHLKHILYNKKDSWKYNNDTKDAAQERLMREHGVG